MAYYAGFAHLRPFWCSFVTLETFNSTIKKTDKKRPKKYFGRQKILFGTFFWKFGHIQILVY